MREPVIFLSFANQQDKPLKELSEEDNIVYSALSSMPGADSFTIHRDSFASADTIIRMLINFTDQVSIFHFAGHASSDFLELVDRHVQGSGLIQLLALQKPIQLVFLNGCYTSGFIKKLLDAGVPVVIGTSREINDAEAVKLSGAFYAALTKGLNIDKAFATAKAAVESNPDVKPGLLSRGIKLPQADTKDFPWGIYYNDEKELKWQLRNAFRDVNPLPRHAFLRIAILAFLTISALLWGITHLGYDNLQVYLYVLIALFTIPFGLIRFIGNRYPGTEMQINKLFRKAGKLLLKPITVIVSAIVVIGLFVMISSVRIDHSGHGPIKAQLFSPEGNYISAWHINEGNSDQTLLVSRINPIDRKYKLQIDGYDDLPVHYPLFTGMKFPADSLKSNPVFIARIPYLLLRLRTHLNLDVDINGKPYLDNMPFGNTGAILIGKKNVSIPDTMIQRWNHEIMQLGEESRKSILDLWQFPARDSIDHRLQFRDQLTIRLLDVDSQVYTRQFIISKPIEDLLLQNQ